MSVCCLSLLVAFGTFLQVSLNGIMNDLQRRNEEAKEALRAAFRVMDEEYVLLSFFFLI